MLRVFLDPLAYVILQQSEYGIVHFTQATMGSSTRTCLKLCQSTSNVVITPRFKGHSIASTLIAFFLCFISRRLEYANQIFALGSRTLYYYFNIGVFHRQACRLHAFADPYLSKKKKNSKFLKNFFSTFTSTLAFIRLSSTKPASYKASISPTCL